MSEQIQTEGLSLSNIFKLFLSKIKLLIIVLICGVIAGGALGFFRSNGVNYYGTRLEFYINPESPEDSVNSESTYGVYGAYGKHVMDNMIKLLSSEIFAEKLMLTTYDEELNEWVVNDLPKQGEWESENNVLDTLIQNAQPAVTVYNTAKAELEAARKAKNECEVQFNNSYAELKAEWQDLFGTTFSKVKYDELDLSNAKYAALKELYEKCDTDDNKVQEAEEDVRIKQESFESAKADYKKAVNPVLAAWRKTETYKAALYQYREAVGFSYIEETANMEDAADLARSFIYVNINVLGDANKAFAEDLMARIQVQVPDYVSENMIVPSGYSGTRCIEITTTSGIALTNPSYMKDSIIKFALLGGIALFVLACVALVIIDSSDKRVRSYEQIDRYLKVPLLGIIPSIDEEKINAWNENMKNGKGEEQL